MSDNTGRYIKPGRGPSAPGVLFCVVPVTRTDRHERYSHITVRSLVSVWACVSYRRRGKWSVPIVANLNDGIELREWMEANAMKGRRNWVVSPIASDALTLTGWWEYVDRMGCRMADRKVDRSCDVPTDSAGSRVVFDALVVRGTPDIVGYTHKGASWRWVSGRQYYPDGAETGSAGVNAPGGDRGANGVQSDNQYLGGEAECRRWHSAIVQLADWWLTVSQTPFGCTIGQMSVGMLRSYSPPKMLVTHNDEDTHMLERSAAYGGRASTWYVGNIGHGLDFPIQRFDSDGKCYYQEVDGPVYHMDVRSMYPWLMREHLFPVRRLYYRERMSVPDLLSMCKNYGVIAHVSADTPKAEYPVREGERVTYPVGRIVSTLTGPELLRLACDGAIVKVHRCAFYKLGRPFEQFASKMMALRVKARDEGRKPDEAFAKLLANSLSGKLAQRSGGWERDPASDEPGRWGESFAGSVTTGLCVRRRHIAGIGWRWVDDVSGKGPYTFAFAYLCAYGRLHMRALRERCPAGSVVSQDTDGIHVLQSGYDALSCVQGLVGEAPGQLSKKGSGYSARFFGPRHYWVEGEWTLSGFSSKEVDLAALTVVDTTDSTLWSNRPRSAPTTVNATERRSALKLDIGDGVVQPDGWVDPRIRRAAPDDGEW